MVSFDLRTVSDDSIFDSARHTYAYTMDLPVEADAVWSGLTAQQPLSWCRSLRGAYTSPGPFGVGTTRTVTVDRLLTLQEEFFIWDEDERRHAFYVTRMNVPVFSAFAEDYRVTPTAGGCRFVWRFAMEGRSGLAGVVALSQPLTRKLLLDKMVDDTRRHFGGLAADER